MIAVKNLTVNFVEEFASVYNLNFEIKSNTLFIADDLDASFAILRTLAKINKNYKGEIYIDNINLKQIKNKFLPLSLVPNEPYLFNSNIDKNLIFPLKIRKINKKIAQNTINSIKNVYNLNNFPQKIKKMDLSQKKIICLIRAIIRKPKYVLLENFFENLEENYVPLAEKIIADASKFSTIIATEKNIQNAYKHFEIVNLEI